MPCALVQFIGVEESLPACEMISLATSASLRSNLSQHRCQHSPRGLLLEGLLDPQNVTDQAFGP